jgi:diguanylate cyclase (GGDEF)-like protein
LNDQYGRAELDKHLQEIAEIIANAVEGRGELIHYFGDEFIVLLPNVETDEAAATAERLRVMIEGHDFSPAKLRITASFGVTSSRPGRKDTELVEEAREAAFVSKLKGKNMVTTTPITREERLLLLERIDKSS